MPESDKPSAAGAEASGKCLNKTCTFFGSEKFGGLCSGCAAHRQSITSQSITNQSATSQSLNLIPDGGFTRTATTTAGRKRSNVEVDKEHITCTARGETSSYTKQQEDTISYNFEVGADSNKTSLYEDAGSPPKGKRPKVQHDRPSNVQRCSICRKKVGLLGFDCRCGGLFCSAHRGDRDHDCPFDYKTLQRAQLAVDNPQIIAEKITKI